MASPAPRRKLNVKVFLSSSWFFETGLLCVTALAVLKLSVDQAGLELTEILLLPECRD